MRQRLKIDALWEGLHAAINRWPLDRVADGKRDGMAPKSKAPRQCHGAALRQVDFLRRCDPRILLHPLIRGKAGVGLERGKEVSRARLRAPAAFLSGVIVSPDAAR